MSDGTLSQEAKSRGISTTSIISTICSLFVIGLLMFMLFSRKGQAGGFTKNPARMENISEKDKVLRKGESHFDISI